MKFSEKLIDKLDDLIFFAILIGLLLPAAVAIAAGVWLAAIHMVSALFK